MEEKTSNMIRTIFGVDNGFIRACERILDMVVLNLLFLISCLPIVTIGPAKMALYQVLFALRHQKRVPIFPTYLSAFKNHFKQGLVFGLMEGAICSLCLFNLLVVSRFTLSGGRLVQLVAVAILLLSTAIFLYVFPMAVRYEMRTKEIVRTSFLLAGIHFPWTFLMVGMILLLTTLLYTSTLTFLLGLSLMLLAGFAVLGYGQIVILERLFQRYPTIS